MTSLQERTHQVLWDKFPEQADSAQDFTNIPIHPIFGHNGVVSQEFTQRTKRKFSRFHRDAMEELKRSGKDGKSFAFEKSAQVDVKKLPIIVRPLKDEEEELITKRINECILGDPCDTTDEKSDTPDKECDDYMAGVWKRLECYNKFIVTHPNFNIYRQKKKHWSLNVKVSRNRTEKAREKCEQWLSSCFGGME